MRLDPYYPSFYLELLGLVYLSMEEYEKAIAELKKAIALSPNDADQIVGLGYILNFAGKPEEAIGLVKKSDAPQPHVSGLLLMGIRPFLFINGSL